MFCSLAFMRSIPFPSLPSIPSSDSGCQAPSCVRFPSKWKACKHVRFIIDVGQRLPKGYSLPQSIQHEAREYMRRSMDEPWAVVLLRPSVHSRLRVHDFTDTPCAVTGHASAFRRRLRPLDCPRLWSVLRSRSQEHREREKNDPANGDKGCLCCVTSLPR